MDNFFFISILACVLGGIVYSSFWYLSRKSRRAKHLTQSARCHEFRFEGDIDAIPKDKFTALRLFSLRVPGKMKNVLKCDTPSIWIFDYEYCITWDQAVGQTVAMIEMRKTQWPPTVIEIRKRERFTVAAIDSKDSQFATRLRRGRSFNSF